MFKKLLILLVVALIGYIGITEYLNYIDTPPVEPPQDEESEDETEESVQQSFSHSVMKLQHTMHQGEQTTVKQGSAVVIALSDGWYIALSNYHIMTKEDYETVSIVLTDWQGYTYNAQILTSYDNHAEVLEYSAEYDLVLLGFEQGVNELPLTSYSESSYTSSSIMLAVGYPNNTLSVSTGNYVGLTTVPGYEHQLLETSAIIAHGSSGGGLFDMTGHLVGITTMAVLENDTFITGYTIPVNNILEYIALVSLEQGDTLN